MALVALDSYKPVTLFVVFISTIFFLLRKKRVQSKKTENLPPSPPKIRILGNLHQLGILVHHSLRDLSDKYGPLMLLHFGSVPTLIVSSAEMAKEITKNVDFCNRPFLTSAKTMLYGCSSLGFAPYGESWRQMKKMCVLELLSVKRVRSFQSVREEEVALMIDDISRSCLMASPVNLSEMIMILSNNIISRCVLGRKDEGENGKNETGQLLREMMKLIAAFSFADFFPWLGWMDHVTGLVSKMKKVSGKLDAFLDQVIDEHKDRTENNDPNYNKDFCDLLLDIQKSNFLDSNFTRDNIKAILLDMVNGGSDTISITLEWAMSQLMRNPKVMKKVQEEVREVVGNKPKVDDDDISKMDYMKAVIKETLRINPAGPLLVPRQSYVSTTVNGYHVPANTMVFINVWAIQRDPKVWDRAEEFIPERFMDNTIDFKGQDFDYIPFGSGRRICPGISFGVAAVEFILANLLYCFDWKLPGDAKEDELDMTESFGGFVDRKVPLCLVPLRHSS